MKITKTTPNFQETKEHPEYLIDRISDFPDLILTLILSSLPTKNAVASSVLSKRWKSLWTTVPNLDFCDNGSENFIRFVNGVLRQHNAPSLHKFRLIWSSDCNPSKVNSWITTAIAKNVCQLDLCLDNRKCEFPTSIFSCETLQSLELKGIMCVPASIVVCLPKLETLKLVSVYFKSYEALQKIIRECPVLNYLHLHLVSDMHLQYFINWSEFKYIISSTSLRRLEICVDSYGETQHFEVELEASSLEYLKLEGYVSQISVQGSLSSLVEADCRIQWSDNSDFNKHNYNSLVEVVRAFDCAKSLTLATHVMWALSHTTTRLSTKFSRLKELKDSIKQQLSEENVADCNHVNWIAPEEVPRCLLNSLKAVVFEFDCYSAYVDDHEMIGSVDDREMIGFLLKHGTALEVMHIIFHGENETDLQRHSEFFQMISNFPRKSTACEVKSSTSCLVDPMGCEMILW